MPWAVTGPSRIGCGGGVWSGSSSPTNRSKAVIWTVGGVSVATQPARAPSVVVNGTPPPWCLRSSGGTNGALAPAFDERPAVSGLATVMVAAEEIEQVEHGELAPGPVDAVVNFQAGHSGTPLGLEIGRRGRLGAGALLSKFG